MAVVLCRVELSASPSSGIRAADAGGRAPSTSPGMEVADDQDLASGREHNQLVELVVGQLA